MQYLYNIVAILLVIVATPVLIYRAIREDGFVERVRQSIFGQVPQDDVDRVAGKNCIWLHAASVGEIVAASPLVKEFHKEFPRRPILVSVVTSSGYDMAKRILKDADSIIYFPMDLPFLGERVIKRIRPGVFMPVETELWPNFLKAIRKYKIPAMMVNGRISDKSVKRYHYLRGLLKDMLGTIDKFCMQSPIDAQYIIQLGADPSLVTVTGNTKFDQTYTSVSESEREELCEKLHLTGAYPILMAGSTHRGEEEILLESFLKIKKEYPKAKLILAPRDIMRAGDLSRMVQKKGMTSILRTEADKAGGGDVILLDTIGELGRLYSVGDIVFVGGSLIEQGGHNILEPAAHGKAILVGPYMFNFKDSYALFSGRGACLTVHNETELTDTVLRLMKNSEEKRAMEEQTLQIIAENGGAALKSREELRELLDRVGERRVSVHKERFLDHKERVMQYLYTLVYNGEEGFFRSSVLALLRFCSIIYGAMVSLNLGLFKKGILPQTKLNATVISLGNITVGGTGKTPTAERIAKWIRDDGHRVAILNRGYRAKWKGSVGVVSDGSKIYMSASEAGDEAYLLAKNLPGVAVIIGSDRSKTGAHAISKLGVDVLILDDGYQHWKLDRDLDIVLIDAAANSFGNNYILPRGTLRETLPNLDRADICLLTKVDQAEEGNCERVCDTIRKYNQHAPIIQSIHDSVCFLEIADWYKSIPDSEVDLEAIKGQRIIAFSAIGNPKSFEQSIASRGAQIVDAIRFQDHHEYTMAEMQDILESAVQKNVCALVTTEKDAVKIPPEFIHSKRGLPVYILKMELKILPSHEEFLQAIKQKMKN
ncbi:MAG: tetraacyldisaccharide 4'-kinase [Selenomonadales bacterium]|nr:tetraacyldisaccharide 4'-kinase [Selenomonadales bacterium]